VKCHSGRLTILHPAANTLAALEPKGRKRADAIRDGVGRFAATPTLVAQAPGNQFR
jgi:hypothetical protein